VAAGSSAVASVAIALATRFKPLTWSLEVLMWGTGLRAETILPLALLWLLGRRAHLWLVTSSLPALLGVVAPQTTLLHRLLINAPLPLLLASMAEGRGLVAYALASLATALVLLSRITPVAY
jgi:Cu/Ag efflux pump CusA